MKAVVINRYGGPDVLTYQNVDMPSVGPDEVLINLKMVGLNHFDIDAREGISSYPDLSFPHILGLEGAGIVSEVGENVETVKVGDKAAPYLVMTKGRCWRAECLCAMGYDNLCHDFDKIGVSRWGTYAEYIKVPEHSVIRLPDRMSFTDAAATQIVMPTAWELVVTKARVRQGEDVLVNAAGSGVGSAAVQIAKNAGARVIASAGSDEKLEHARELGAHAVINYRDQDLVEEVMNITDGRGVDVVIEMVGGEILQKSLASLAYNGRISTAGAHAGEKVKIDIIEFFRKQASLTSTNYAPKHTCHRVLELVAEGILRPVVHAVYPLNEARRGHELLESRNLFGKILLEV